MSDLVPKSVSNYIATLNLIFAENISSSILEGKMELLTKISVPLKHPFIKATFQLHELSLKVLEITIFPFHPISLDFTVPPCH